MNLVDIGNELTCEFNTLYGQQWQNGDNMNKKLSICIPTYNRAHTLKYTLDSICQQIVGFENEIEICISNNASIDDTELVVMAYKERLPIKYHKMKENVYGLQNLNQTIEHMAQGDYVLMIGDDDIFINDGIKRLFKLITDFPYDYIYLNHTHKPFGSIKKIVDEAACTMQIISKECECYELSDKHIDKWEELLNFDGKCREANMLFIGNHLFKNGVWKIDEHLLKIKVEDREFDEDSLDYYYNLWSPQITTFARAMMGKECYYSGNPIVLQGMGENIDEMYSVRFLTFLQRWIDMYKEFGMDEKILQEYINYMDFHASERLANLMAHKRYLVEKYPMCLNYFSNNLSRSNLVVQLYDGFRNRTNDYFEQASTNMMARQIKQTINQTTGKVVLWGTGDVARNYINSSQELRNRIDYVVDGNIKLHGKRYELLNIPICAPDTLKNVDITFVVIASIKYEYEIIEYLKNEMKKNVKVFCSQGIIEI